MTSQPKKAIWQILPIALFFIFAAVNFTVSPANLLYAVQSAAWEVNDANGWRRGEMEGAVINQDGYLSIGTTSTKIALISKAITDEDTGLWCNAKLGDRVFFGSAKGVVYELNTKENKLDEFFTTGEWLVTTMAENKGNIFVGTIPNGKIFKVDQAGKGSLFATLPETSKYVWQICFDKNDNMYVAAGPEGKIYKIDNAGKVEVFYDTKKKNVLSILFDGANYFYAGTADPGIVYRISLKGRPEIMADFGEMEIKSLAYYRDKEKEELYIGANKALKTPPQEFLGLIQESARKAAPPPATPPAPKSTTPAKPGSPEKSAVPPGPDNKDSHPESQIPNPKSEITNPPLPPKSDRSEGGDEEPVTPPPPGPTAGGATAVSPAEAISAPPPAETPRPPVHCVVYQISNGLIKELVALNDCYVTEIRINKDSNILVATDNSGRIYQVLPTGKYFVPYEFDAGQVLTLAMDSDYNLYAAGTGKKAAVYLMLNDLALQGSFTSEALDAKFPAKWGIFSFKGQGSITLQTQSGNCAKPDETWSDWSEKITFKADDPVAVIPASPAARYFRVKIVWTDKNVMIKEIVQNYLIHNQQPKIMDFKVNLPQPPQPTGIPPRVLARKVNFHAQDPDNDMPSYRLYYRNENQKVWVLLNQEQPGGFIMGEEYYWNTESLPDGRYYLKLVATDERVNPQGTGLSDERISEAIIVDNTRPQIKEIVVNGMLECTGRVEDNLSQIARIEYALDGGKWELVFPLSGMYDSKVEEFLFTLPNVSKGIHNVAIRAFDIFGNMGLESVEIDKK